MRTRRLHLARIASGTALFVALASWCDSEPSGSTGESGTDAPSAAISDGSENRPSERTWTVTCGLPQDVNPNSKLLPAGGYTGPWPGDPGSGHLEVKTLNRPRPEGGVVSEMWVLSRYVGWWKLKAIWVHPDDLPKLDLSKVIAGVVEKTTQPEIRQIIDSPFLSQPAVVRGGNADDENLVDGQILALMPDASRLRCAPQTAGDD